MYIVHKEKLAKNILDPYTVTCLNIKTVMIQNHPTVMITIF